MVAVVAAITMLIVLGVGAVVIDAGAMYAERRQLQNGADAAALAIAYQCAGGDCGDVEAMAQTFADGNANDGTSTVDEVVMQPNRAIVHLSTSTVEGGSAIRHWFAPVFTLITGDGDRDETTVFADAAADWGGISSGTGIVPLAISWCAFVEHTGGGIPSDEIEQTITYLSEAGDCVGPSGHTIPGGFGWLETDGECTVWTTIDDPQTPGKPGVSTPGDCDADDFASLRDETVFFPVYEQSGGTGASGWFQIHGYAAFHVTGFRFACPSAYRWNDGGGACGPNTARFIRGYFTELVDPTDMYELGGPTLGAWAVGLTR
ncbi:MAG: pilus assembly protein TadG-related protein [Nitriliruptoraceae bacterium]